MKNSPAPDWDGRDPLPAENEDARQALTLLWLAESAPLTAAPPDSLSRIKSELELPQPVPLRRSGPWRTVFAATGWAAAACLAVLLWRNATPDPAPRPAITGTPPRERTVRPPALASRTAPPRPSTGSVMVQPLTDPAELRRQLAGMRAARTEDPAGTHRPVIRELRPPGSALPAVGHDRVLDLIATALESDLNRRSAVRSNNREVVIESGWANWASMPGDVTFRHRQFPASRWEELGLMRSAGGQFLDPASGWLWTPEPGSRDYTGQPAPAGLDRSLFAAAASTPDTAAENPAATAAASTSTRPAGFLITGSGGDTIIALSGLPELPTGAALYMTGYDNSGSAVRYGVNSAGLVTSDGWSFSGIIPADAGSDFSQGFDLEIQDPAGTSNIILSTGATGR